MPTTMRPGDTKSIVLWIVLVTTMIASTFQVFAIATLASPIIDDLEISRWTLGLAGSANTLTGALSAPYTGRLTDRIGPSQSVTLICVLAALGMGIMMTATSIWVFVASCVLSGIPQGWGNSATNALIAGQAVPGQRGTITGIKQSGVTVAVFLAGAAVPTVSASWGWHLASGLFAAVFLIFAGMNAVLLATLFAPHRNRSDEQASTSAGSATSRAAMDATASAGVPDFIWKMMIYAFLMGTSSGAIGRFLPLFAEESIGMTTRSAGFLMAVVGICGIGFRILTARIAEHRVEPSILLRYLALTAIVTSLMLASAGSVGSWVLWPTAVLYALGHISWNAVVHLAIINDSPLGQAGRLSGIVMLGFLMGMSIGGPATGLIADSFGTYQPVWYGAAVLALGAVAAISSTSAER